MQTQTEPTSSATHSSKSGGNGQTATAKDAPRNLIDVFTRRAAESGSATAMKRKVGGQWVASTWAEWDGAAREIAGGFLALGLSRGDRVALLAQTRTEWAHCEIGILMAGGTVVPIYPSNTPDQCEYVVTDAGARFVVCDTPAQLGKLFLPESAAKLTHIGRFVYMDDRCVLDKPDAQGRSEISLDQAVPAEGRDRLTTLATLRESGKAWLAANPGALEKRWAEVGAADVFTFVYTSGTTGNPKGVVLTHGNMVFEVGALDGLVPVGTEDEQLLFLPLAHIFARILLWMAIQRGVSTAYAEGIPQLSANMKEVQPTFMGSVPRIYEKVYAKVVSGARDAGGAKAAIFNWAVGVGRRASAQVQRGEPVTGLLAIQNGIADKLVFSKLKAAFGGRLRFFISGGAPLAKEIAEFFHAAGILILEGYGLTETTAATHLNSPAKFRFGSVGQALPGVEVRIAGDGEILMRGPNILREYHGKPEATREAIDEQGWFHSGDIGVEDGGFLRITDRKKDIIVTAGGKNIAPQNLENQLKTLCPLVSQVMVHGDKRAYLVALITLGEEPLVAWGKDKGVPGSYAELTRNETVRGIVAAAVKELNGKLASYESLKKYEVLDRDFSQDAGELTPTLKVKRKQITEKYQAMLDAMYG